MDHIKRKTLKLHNIKAMVLDEADEMLRMGFIDDVEWVLDNIPEERQIALFSATMPPVIRKVANKHLNDPKVVKIESSTTTNAKITQTYLPVKGPHKLEALTRILEAKAFDGVIIFVRTKNATTELAEKLEARGYSSAPINGDIVQKQRERTIDRLKKGSLDILIATDVAARGIDVERVTLVVNYDIPYDAEAYTHRIGRTGRAGREGEAILFVAPREQRMLQTIERTTRQKIEPMKLPSVDQINEHRLERFKQKITDAMVAPGIEPFYKLVKEFQEEHDSDPVNIAAALAKLLQGDEPLFLQDRPLQYQESSYDRNDRGGRERNGRDRDSRGGRDRDRGDRPRRERTKAAPEGMTRFRISVGRNHKVKPGNIVGAIANEGGIDSKNIGPIEIHDGFTTVDLPQNLNRETINTIGNAWVCGQKMSMVPFDGNAPAGKPSGNSKKDRGDRSDRSDNRGNRGDARDATKKAVSPFKKNKDASSSGKKSYKDNPISKGKPKKTLKIEK
jgi:ATP-dependent RNA helicase DeaD